MKETNVIEQIERQFGDIEYRQRFGAELAKLHFAMALVEARRKAGLTQRELADLAGVKQPTIAALEHGDANPTIGKLGSIFALLDQTIEVTPVPLATSSGQPDVAGRNGYGKTNGTHIREARGNARLVRKASAKGGRLQTEARRKT